MTDKKEPYTTGCGLRGICGGCFFDIPYPEELKLKEQRVLNLLSPFTDAHTLYDGITMSPEPLFYRNKMEYSFGDNFKGGPLTLGLHRKKSFYDVFDASACMLVHRDFNEIVAAAGDFFRKKGTPFYHKRSRIGYLRHLVVRRSHSTGEILIDLVTSSQMDKDSEKSLLLDFKECLLELSRSGRLEGHIASFFHTENDSVSDAVKDGGTLLLYGQGFISENILGLKFLITPFSFFQTNTSACTLLYERIREYARSIGINKDITIYDLYSGAGLIAQILSGEAKRVVGVEIVKEAVEAATSSAKLNGLSNVEFKAADVLYALDTLPAPDLIVLDPPREGVNKKALKKIVSYSLPHMVYVSCRPESLAADMALLSEAGYRLSRFGIIDQFPRANHVETVVLMSRAGA